MDGDSNILAALEESCLPARLHLIDEGNETVPFYVTLAGIFLRYRFSLSARYLLDHQKISSSASVASGHSSLALLLLHSLYVRRLFLIHSQLRKGRRAHPDVPKVPAMKQPCHINNPRRTDRQTPSVSSNARRVSDSEGGGEEEGRVFIPFIAPGYYKRSGIRTVMQRSSHERTLTALLGW